MARPRDDRQEDLLRPALEEIIDLGHPLVLLGRDTATGRRVGGKPLSLGALYLILQNRLYRGEIVHNGQSHPGEHTPIIDQPLWDAVQAQAAANTPERNSSTRTRQPSLLTGMLFDGDNNRMTPTHATKKGRRYHYYVSRPLIINDQSDGSAGLRISAGEIEQAVTNSMRQWLVDPGSVYQATRLADPSAQRRLIARAAEIGRSWPELPAARQRALLTALIERIDVGANRIDIHFRLTRLGMVNIAAPPSPGETDGQTQILSVPIELRRSGRETKILIEGADPFATAKPDARLIKLLIRARRARPTKSADPPGTLRPTQLQWRSLKLEPAVMRAFRPEQVTEGTIAVDDDLTTPVFSHYSGRVTKVIAMLGDVVEPGAPLFVIHASEFVQAQNDLITALANLQSARSQFTMAQTTEKRTHELYLAQGGSLKDWQQAQTDLITAQNTVRSDETALHAVRNRLRILGKTDEEIASLEAQPTQKLEPVATVTAPVRGTITQSLSQKSPRATAAF